MRHRIKSIVALLGSVAMVAGVLLLLDGLLPLRSRGPNPSWLEVILGLVVGVAGFLGRRMVRPVTANPSTSV